MNLYDELTEKELNFFKRFLDYNGCGAKTPKELLEDNFSCQCIEDLRDVFPEVSNNEIGGLLSSLEVKGFLNLEERDGSFCKSKSKAKQMIFEPDLYWASDSVLEELEDKEFLEL